MASSLVFTLLALSAVSLASEVPVFLWGDLAKTSLKASPLTTLEADEFSGILTEELTKDPFTVIFIEETLSVEDFSRKNDGETSFPFLHANIGDSVYLPSVESALQALNNLADPDKVDHVKLTENGLSAEIEPESGKFLFINLKDAKEGESRFELLRRHNDFMEDMFGKLQERYSKVVAIYTAHYPSWTVPETHSRLRRATNETVVNATEYSANNFLMSAIQIDLMIGNTTNTLTGPVVSSDMKNGTQNVTFDYGTTGKLVFRFTNDDSYWYFESVVLDGQHTLEPMSEVYALSDHSFRCLPNTSFTTFNDTVRYTLSFIDIKLQPFLAGPMENQTFGESFNCVGFFSAPIWSGLMVTFVLLAITFYGIMMMMDIRTMDRFDDAKGKTITINAAE